MSVDPPAGRELDLVLFGATGFVGELIAEHLVETAPDGVRVGLAGRSQARLRDLRVDLGPRASDWPLIVADASEGDSLVALAARARVVASAVGPYAKYGMALVEACAAAGTHYCDLTGEVLFVRRSIDAYDALAKVSGARIVHACGFDSIPSDLGVFATAARARADGQGE
ncbi:MAG TPA: saccharopine dehydrogenase NADP-binding domain-containing protein, partial [Candidatus Lustribacter sp.]|nr:saccharopine dehydrogenase NADP-binding domain-containing protein [Candidatus Lustribacter sp.]